MNTVRNTGFLLALLFGATFAAAQAVGETKPASGADARARLDAAASIVESLRGTKGPGRLGGMRKAASAYEAVARDFATDSGVLTKALWGAGECWRRAGELEAAADAYGRLLDGAAGGYRQRALFERASMLRRTKRFDEALDLYQEAGRITPDGVRAHDARIWVARVQELRGEPDLAIAAYRAAVDAAVGVRRTIEACDASAKAMIRGGDLEAARRLIERADEAAQPTIENGGAEAERISRALEEMGARRQLQRALDKANDAGGDAVRLERDRRR